MRPSWPPTSPGRKEFNGGQVLERWAGSSCEPKAGNAPQEPSSHSQPPLRSLFTALPSRSSEKGGPGKGREIGAEVEGGRPATHRPTPSPIPAGASCWQFPQSHQALPDFRCLELHPAKSLWPHSQRPLRSKVYRPWLPWLIPGALDAPASLIDLGFPLLCSFGHCCPHWSSLQGQILQTFGSLTKAACMMKGSLGSSTTLF